MSATYRIISAACAAMLAATFNSCASTVTPPSMAEVQASRLISAAAAQVRRCYRAPKIPSAGKQIITKLQVRYGADGNLAGLPQLVSQSGVTPGNSLYAAPMAQAAIASVIRCSPLPVSTELLAAYHGSFFLTFSPSAVV